MYYITLLPGDYVLLDEDSLKSSLEPILRTLFAAKQITDSQEEPTEFIHFHLSTSEVSIIIPHRYLHHFNSSRITAPYRALRVDTNNPGLEESGILATITMLFKKYSLSILSVSTYRYNYIFVQTSDIPTFDKMMSENSNILCENLVL